MYLKPSRRKKRRRLTSIIIAVAIAAAAVLGIFLYLDNFTDFSFTKPMLKETSVTLPENAAANANGILYMQDGSLYLMDKTGAESWSLKLNDGGASKFTASEKLICSYSQTSLQVLTFNKEELFTTSLDSEIMGVQCGNNTVAVLTGAVDETGIQKYYIYLFNEKGEQSGKPIDFSTRPVIDFGFQGENDMLWALSLNSAGVVPVSYVTTYKTDGSITGNIEINTQLIERVTVTGDSIFASGTNNLIKYNYFGEKQGDVSIYGWKPVAASNGASLTLAYISRADLVNIESVLIITGDLSSHIIRLPYDVFSVAVSQNKLYAYTANEIYEYTFDGKLERSVKIDQPITMAKQVSSDTAVVWDAQKSYLMSLS